MKLGITFSLILVCGCSHLPPPHPVDANADETSAMGTPSMDERHPCTGQNGCDQFDKAGDYAGAAVASGSRMVYDKSIQAYRFLTSEETKAYVEGKYDALHDTLIDLQMEVQKKLDEHGKKP